MASKRKKPIKKSKTKPQKTRRQAASKTRIKLHSQTALKRAATLHGLAARKKPAVKKPVVRKKLTPSQLVRKLQAENARLKAAFVSQKARADLDTKIAMRESTKARKLKEKLVAMKERIVRKGKRPSRLLDGYYLREVKPKGYKPAPEKILPRLYSESEIRKDLSIAPLQEPKPLSARRKSSVIALGKAKIRQIARRAGVAAPKRSAPVKARVFLTSRQLFQAANAARVKYRERPDKDGRFEPIGGGRSVTPRELKARMKQAYYWAGVRAMAKNQGWPIKKIREIIRSQKYEGKWRELASELGLFKESPGIKGKKRR